MAYESRAITVALLVGLVTIGIGCASVDTGTEDQDDWPEAPERPWEAMETPEASPVAGWDGDETDEDRRQNLTGLFDLGFWFYANGLTEIDGARCEHRPTCSVYAYRAVGKHGFVIGTMLAVDRLMRDERSSVLRQLPTHSIHEGMMLFDDPVEENDFFL